jgi:hypothetical protein
MLRFIFFSLEPEGNVAAVGLKSTAVFKTILAHETRPKAIPDPSANGQEYNTLQGSQSPAGTAAIVVHCAETTRPAGLKLNPSRRRTQERET